MLVKAVVIFSGKVSCEPPDPFVSHRGGYGQEDPPQHVIWFVRAFMLMIVLISDMWESGALASLQKLWFHGLSHGYLEQP